MLGDGVGRGRRPRSGQQTGERYEQRRHDVERPLLPPDELYLPPDALRERLNQGARIEVCGARPSAPRTTRMPLGDQPAPDAAAGGEGRTRRPTALKSFLPAIPAAC